MLAGNGDSLDRQITLELLRAVQGNAAVTQRTLARELGIALGLANSYVKRCINKGLIKAKQVPRNRYAYYLTPKGFAEKTRLAAEFFSQSLSFFRQAQHDADQIFSECRNRGWKRIALVGAGDLAEVFVLVSRAYPVSVVGILDARVARDSGLGIPVFGHAAELGEIDACVISDFKNPRQALKTAVAALSADRVFVPRLLEISSGNGPGGPRQ